MDSKHLPLFQSEMSLATVALNERRFDEASKHFTRAHDIGFYFSWPHMLAHYGMLKVALAQRNIAGILLQPILIFFAIFSPILSPLVVIVDPQRGRLNNS